MYPKSIAYHSHCIPLETVPTFLILCHLEVYPRSLCIQSYIFYELQKNICKLPLVLARVALAYIDPKDTLKPKLIGFSILCYTTFYMQKL